MSGAPLFTVQRRKNLLESLIAFFKVDHTIAGAMLVGASAEPRQDAFSGLSIEVIVNPTADFSLTYRKWREYLPTMMTTVGQVEHMVHGSHATIALMLEGYLELTLYFMGLNQMLAPARLWKFPDGSTRLVPIINPAPRPWKLLYANPSVKDKLIELINNCKDVPETNTLDITYRELVRGIWQPIVHAVVALQRGEIWRAISRVDEIRNKIIHLASLNYGVDVRQYAEVDQLPEMLLVALRHTIPTNTSDVAIRRSLLNAVHLFFSQAQILEETSGSELESAPIRQRMLEYVENYS